MTDSSDWERWTRLLVRIPAFIAVFVVGAYRAVISPVLPATCRFYPSCSEYMMEALRRHGLLKGLYLGCRRILRCHPGHPGGCDPVP